MADTKSNYTIIIDRNDILFKKMIYWLKSNFKSFPDFKGSKEQEKIFFRENVAWGLTKSLPPEFLIPSMVLEELKKPPVTSVINSL